MHADKHSTTDPHALNPSSVKSVFPLRNKPCLDTEPACWLSLVVLVLGLMAVCLYEVPYFALGERAHVRVHDNLAPIVSTYAARCFDGNQTGSGALRFMLGSLPGEALALEPKLGMLWYHVLSPYHAYLANDLFVRLVAFAGMFVLLQGFRHRNLLIQFGVALCFAILPFFTSTTGLAAAGLPLVLAAARYALRADAPGRVGYCGLALLLFLFPFDASLPFGGVHILLLMLAAWAIQFVRTRRTALPFLCCVFVLAGGYVAANWGFLANLLSENPIVWHRVERDRILPVFALANKALGTLVFSQYHAPANPVLIWITGGLLLGVAGGERLGIRFVRRTEPEDGREEEESACRACWFLVASILAIALFYFAYRFFLATGFGKHAKTVIPLIGSFQFDRFYFLYPLLFSILFYLVLWLFWCRGRLARAFVVLMLVLQAGYCIMTADWIRERDGPTFAEFKSEALFDAAAAMLPAPRTSYRIACFGFFPGVAHLNGFLTVDGYWPLYPLTYKHRFRKVIRKELEKSEELRTYFDDWGSRCYVMSAELGKQFYITKHSAVRTVEHLEIDTSSLASLGASYLFSSILIDNSAQLELRLLGHVEDAGAAIDVYVYALPNTAGLP